jgi:transcription initiation factor TFIID subunit 7
MTGMIHQKRFEDALKKLTADLEMKQAQRDEMKEKQRMRKEGVILDPETPDGGVNEGDGDLEQEGGDLFGSDDQPMDIG